jgi:hypothetical protein
MLGYSVQKKLKPRWLIHRATEIPRISARAAEGKGGKFLEARGGIEPPNKCFAEINDVEFEWLDSSICWVQAAWVLWTDRLREQGSPMSIRNGGLHVDLQKRTHFR